MDIGLLGVHELHHYGSVLDAYALPRVLSHCAESLGLDLRAEYIDVRTPGGQGISPLLCSGMGLRPLLTNLHTLWYLPHFRRRQKLFDDFIRRYIPCSSMGYTLPRDLERACQAYPLLLRLEEGPPCPTLLLPDSHWETLAEDNTLSPLTARPPIDEGYLLCYCTDGHCLSGRHVRAYARAHGLRICQLCGLRRNASDADERVFDAGPREFLAYIRNAACVFTDAFHCAVFALLFHKRLYYGPGHRDGGGDEAVMERLGVLRETAVYPDSGLPSGRPDYDAMNQKLDALRQEATAPIRRLLGKC